MPHSVQLEMELMEVRRLTRVWLSCQWVGGVTFLVAGLLPSSRWRAIAFLGFAAVQMYGVSCTRRLARLRPRSTGPGFSVSRGLRERAADAEWSPVLTIGLTVVATIMIVAGGVVAIWRG